jgi:hypothetical protein
MELGKRVLQLLGYKEIKQETFFVDNNKVEIRQKGKNVRLSMFDNYDSLFPNQTIVSIKKLLLNNYQIVKRHYLPIAEKAISANDLNDICLKIVVARLHMYNMWRIRYKKQENRDLSFLTDDFNHPDLSDTVMLYLRKKYPQDYSKKCELMFGMTSPEFVAHEKNRDAFFNK